MEYSMQERAAFDSITMSVRVPSENHQQKSIKNFLIAERCCEEKTLSILFDGEIFWIT